MRNRNCFVLTFLVVLAASAMFADTGVRSITVRDWITHYAVRAKITLQGPESLSVETDDTGVAKLSLPPGQYTQEVSAPGYKTMKGNISPENNLSLNGDARFFEAARGGAVGSLSPQTRIQPVSRSMPPTNGGTQCQVCGCALRTRTPKRLQMKGVTARFRS